MTFQTQNTAKCTNSKRENVQVADEKSSPHRRNTVILYCKYTYFSLHTDKISVIIYLGAIYRMLTSGGTIQGVIL